MIMFNDVSFASHCSWKVYRFSKVACGCNKTRRKVEVVTRFVLMITSNVCKYNFQLYM
jgi:hypothetical protein